MPSLGWHKSTQASPGGDFFEAALHYIHYEPSPLSISLLGSIYIRTFRFSLGFFPVLSVMVDNVYRRCGLLRQQIDSSLMTLYSDLI